MFEPLRKAWAEVDLHAIRDNVAALAAVVAPAELCAVVKADGYGHGALPSASAALQGGASRLAVALVEEGRQLRDAGIDAPILVLSEPQASAMPEVVAYGLTPTLYSMEGVEALADAVVERGGRPVPVHVKVDTGMHRVGAAPDEVVDLLRAIGDAKGLIAEGLFTHLAVADEPGHPLNELQAERFFDVAERLRAEGLLPRVLHAANSAASLYLPRLRLSMVRCGIALYGLAPSPEVTLPAGIRPALSVRAVVSFVKRVESGEGISYGQRYRLERAATIATVPIGYADGLPRALGGAGGQVLIRGKRYPIAGTITMDQFLVDCGDDEVSVGDEVVVLGRQDGDEITAEEIAGLLETIDYEVVCRLGPRLPRVYSARRGRASLSVTAVSNGGVGDSILPDDEPFDPLSPMRDMRQMRPG